MNRSLKVGFVGTSYGMTKQQYVALRNTLEVLNAVHGIEAFHQCDYPGSDEQANSLILQLLCVQIVVYPPKGSSHKHSLRNDITMPAVVQPHLSVADYSDVLIAMPETSVELLRSTTWSAIRQATLRDKFRYVFDLDGNLIEKHSKPIRSCMYE